ncbi:MAG: hypothetical protein AABY55_06290 [Candidatus Omnitrophota bacterium]
MINRNTGYGPGVTLAGVSIEFDRVLFRSIPDSYIPRCKRHAGFKVDAHEVSKFPPIFFDKKRNLGGNLWCAKKEDIEYYHFMDRNGDTGPVAFSYDTIKDIYTLYVLRRSRYYYPFSQNFFQHPLFNGFYDIAFYSAVLSNYQGFLMHAAGFYKNKKEGILVCGHSGDGKSTLAIKLYETGYKIISDDCVAIRQSPKGFYMYPTPWIWKKNVPSSNIEGVYLSSIYFLTKCRRKNTHIRDISMKEFFLKWHEYVKFFSFFKEKTALLADLSLGIAKQAERFQLSYVLKDGINHNTIRLIPVQ